MSKKPRGDSKLDALNGQQQALLAEWLTLENLTYEEAQKRVLENFGVSTTRSDMGTGLELDVIAAVVLGGTSIFGGIGTIAGTVLGFTLIQLLKNGLSLTGVKGDATIVVIGTVLILSILITNFLQHRRGSDG